MGREELYRIRDEGLERTYEVPLSAGELSNEKIREGLLRRIAMDIQEHIKRYDGWTYKMEVKDEKCKELIERGISTYKSPRWRKYVTFLLPTLYAPVAGIISYTLEKWFDFYRFLSPEDVGFGAAVIWGIGGVLLTPIYYFGFLEYLYNKERNERELLREFKINTKERK